jgi:protein subunit release factor B
MFPVSHAKAHALAEQLQRLGIREDDIEESFVRSGGKGGQNVNKVATCVVLVHRPTGTLVKCQIERSQALNRFHARRLLADKIERQQLGAASAAAQRVAKLRRQKRRRSRRAKEKMLAAKHARAETKALRARVLPDGD